MRSIRVAFRWQPPAAAGAAPPPLSVRLVRAGATVVEWVREVLWTLPGGGSGGAASGGWVAADVTLPECKALAGDVMQVRAVVGGRACARASASRFSRRKGAVP